MERQLGTRIIETDNLAIARGQIPQVTESVLNDRAVFADFLCKDRLAVGRIKDAPWSQKIANMEAILAMHGHLGYGEQALNELMLSANGVTIDDLQKRDFIAKNLRNGLSDLQLLQMRELVRINRAEDEIPFAEINYNESTSSPVAHLRTTVGYEIEFPPARGVKPVVYEQLEMYAGIKQGGGGGSKESGDYEIETSPGPFLSEKTAIYIFDTWINAGLIDVNRYKNMTVHFNVGHSQSSQVYSLVRLAHLTGYSYRPSTRKMDTFELKIGRKEKDRITYTEAKEFDLASVEGFRRFFEETTLNSMAMSAYFRSRTNQPLTLDQKRLASVWKYHVIDRLERGLESVDLNNILYKKHSNNLALRAHKDILGVYPTEESILHTDPWGYEGNKVKVGAKTYPNLVAFSQEISGDLSNAVRIILTSAETDFVNEVHGLNKIKKITISKIEEITSRFPCGTQPGDPPEYKMVKIINAYSLLKNKLGK